MQVNLSKISRILLYLLLFVVVASVVAFFIVPGNWKYIVAMGGVLLVLNLILLQFFLKVNSKRPSSKHTRKR